MQNIIPIVSEGNRIPAIQKNDIAQFVFMPFYHIQRFCTVDQFLSCQLSEDQVFGIIETADEQLVNFQQAGKLGLVHCLVRRGEQCA